MPKYKRYKTKYPGVFFIKGTSIANGKTERIYYISYRLHGRAIEEKAGRQFQDDITPAKASLIRAKKINCEIPPNKVKRMSKNEKIWTFNQLWQEYKNNKYHLKRLSDQEYQYNKYIRDTFGDKKPEELKPLEIDRFNTHLSKNHSLHIVKQVLAQIKRVVNFGASRHLCLPLSFKIEIPKFDDRKTEDLTPEQLKKLFEVFETESNDEVVAILKLALFTGMRKSELLKLQWRDISFDRGFILLRDPKGVVQQKIPMNSSAREVFQSLSKRKGSPYLFPSKDGGLRHRNSFDRPLRRIRTLAGLPKDFRPLHGLRHVYASMLASSGQVDMYTLQKLLTHKSPLMTQRYAHLRDETLKRASNLMGKLVDQAINCNQVKKIINLDDYKNGIT